VPVILLRRFSSEVLTESIGDIMENFIQYFLRERKVILENISYETEKPKLLQGELKLGCKDTIVAQLMANGVKINFNRALNFSPEGPFALSVTFSTIMLFDPARKDEVDWKQVDIAGEFRKGCPHILTELMSRTSLMIAQITAASGQNPLMTPASPQEK